MTYIIQKESCDITYCPGSLAKSAYTDEMQHDQHHAAFHQGALFITSHIDNI